MRLDPDEFDCVYYTYSLKLYQNMPLTEPLEYREVKCIREFVIAIDTSGSTSGEPMQKFVQKTYNVLKSTESFFSKISLHIIQCDADIQEDVKITSQLHRRLRNFPRQKAGLWHGVLTEYTGPGGDVVIPDGVTEIEDRVLCGRPDITNISIPDGRY